MPIRLAQEEDLTEVVGIYNQAVAQGRAGGLPATADLTPVTVEERRAWFERHAPETHSIWVFECAAGDVAGWCSLSPYRPGRAALRRVAEISYYVDMACQRQGIGSALVQRAFESCEALGLKTLFALVIGGNEPSIQLLREHGFEQWGRLPRVADFGGEERDHLIYGRRVQP